jgi:fructosamine-3-kinase
MAREPYFRIIALIMTLHPGFVQHLEERFQSFFQAPLRLTGASTVPGGDINQCYRLETSEGAFFMKVNASLFGLDFFEKEARGLLMLANTGAIRVPRPLFDGKFHQQVYLVMEALEKGSPMTGFWDRFGTSIAALHTHHAASFGLEYTNYIGKLHQYNQQHDTWHDFYCNERIMRLVYKARERQMLDSTDVEIAEGICARLKDLVPEERPSLLHGDLWSGNYMVAEDGAPAVFDPAVYYGHRETDLAMARLFGGFDQRFFEAYESASPLQPGAAERIPLFQLYPLLVHLLLFGGAYRRQVEDILRKFA